MKQTLIEIRDCARKAVERGQDADPEELAAIIRRRMGSSPDLGRYMRGLGQFVGQTMAGVIIIPEKWTPPD